MVNVDTKSRQSSAPKASGNYFIAFVSGSAFSGCLKNGRSLPHPALK
ncbi:hypothetical protein NIES2104_53750 [Leptolyngbya sp. NIES-2104]|nr:hypothetical protein NIES2104_53750 [Leptolyngbya sp. NIES-2104]